MSIVGTRPPLISETNLYEPRHKVKLPEKIDYVAMPSKYLKDVFADQMMLASSKAGSGYGYYCFEKRYDKSVLPVYL